MRWSLREAGRCTYEPNRARNPWGRGGRKPGVPVLARCRTLAEPPRRALRASTGRSRHRPHGLSDRARVAASAVIEVTMTGPAADPHRHRRRRGRRPRCVHAGRRGQHDRPDERRRLQPAGRHPRCTLSGLATPTSSARARRSLRCRRSSDDGRRHVRRDRGRRRPRVRSSVRTVTTTSPAARAPTSSSAAAAPTSSTAAAAPTSSTATSAAATPADGRGRQRPLHRRPGRRPRSTTRATRSLDKVNYFADLAPARADGDHRRRSTAIPTTATRTTTARRRVAARCSAPTTSTPASSVSTARQLGDTLDRQRENNVLFGSGRHGHV